MTIHPTALADQLQAASADAVTHLHALADLIGGPAVYEPVHPWLIEQFERITFALTTGGAARFCPHIGAAPRVVHAYAWAPGLLVCPGCTWLATPDAAESTTCDRCRRHVRLLWSRFIANGPVILGYALCRTCTTEVDGDPDARAV